MDEDFEKWMSLALNGDKEDEVDPTLRMHGMRDGRHHITYTIMSSAEDNILTPFVMGFLKFAKGEVYAEPVEDTSNIDLMNTVEFDTLAERDKYLEKIWLHELRCDNVDMENMVTADIHIESEDPDTTLSVLKKDLPDFVKLATSKGTPVNFQCDLKSNGRITVEVQNVQAP